MKHLTRRIFLGSVVGTAMAGRQVPAGASGYSQSAAGVGGGHAGPARRNPGAADAFPRWPVADAREENALIRRHSQRQVGSRGGPGTGLRDGLRRADRRETLPGHRQRHQRPHHLARRARDRARRRGDRPALHVRRDHQCRAADARAARVRRHRSRDVPDRRPQDRAGHQRADARRSSPCTSAARPPTSTPSSTWLAAASPGGRGRLSGAPRRVAGPQGRHLGQRRVLQLPGQQEPELRAKAARSSPTTPTLRRNLLQVPQQQPWPSRTPAPTSPMRDRAPTCASPNSRARSCIAQMSRLEAQARTRDAERRVPHRAAAADPRHHAARMYEAARATRITSTCSATTRAIRGAAEGGVPQGARGGGHSRLGRLLAAQQGAVPRRVLSSRGYQRIYSTARLATGASGTSVRRTIACATRRSGSCRPCCSARGRTWTRSRPPSRGSRRMPGPSPNAPRRHRNSRRQHTARRIHSIIRAL